MTVKKYYTDRPVRRQTFETVKVKLVKAKPSAWFPHEANVTFSVNGKTHQGWMPYDTVNLEEKWLKAEIIGDYKNGDWQIMVPDETMTSTVLLRVPTSEQGNVVQKGW